MDTEKAWEDFKKSNKTSLEDKLDVILAQQQEILTDTSRVAELVPLVTGDVNAEEESEQVAEEQTEQPAEELQPEEPVPEEGTGDVGALIDETSDDGDMFAFLDEDEDGMETTEEDSDVMETTDEESDVADAEEPTEGVPSEDSESEQYDETYEDSDVTDEPVADDTEQVEDDTEVEPVEDDGDTEGEPKLTDSQGNEVEDYISFDELESESEEEEPTEDDKTKKSKVRKERGAYRVINPSKPTVAYAYGSAYVPSEVDEIMKGYDGDDFDIGFGTDPHKAVEKDWEYYRAMKNNFRVF